jgi:hypothetical protein
MSEGNPAGASLTFLAISTVIVLVSVAALVGSNGPGMYGPSPAALLFCLGLLVAGILNCVGIYYARMEKNAQRRNLCIALNCVLPLVILVGFLLISFDVFPVPK